MSQHHAAYGRQADTTAKTISPQSVIEGQLITNVVNAEILASGSYLSTPQQLVVVVCSLTDPTSCQVLMTHRKWLTF